MGKQQNIKKEIKAIRKLFNDKRDTFSRDESDQIRLRLYRKALVYDILKSKPELTDDEKKVYKGISWYLKKLNTNLSKKLLIETIEKITYMAWSNYMMKIHIINLLR